MKAVIVKKKIFLREISICIL